MPDAQIRYGGTELALYKSADLVGVRPAPRADTALHRTLARHGAVAEPQRLGSFQVVNVAAAPAGAEQALDELRREQMVDAGTHIYYTSGDGVPFVPTGALYIDFRAGADLDACQQVLDDLHLEVVEGRGARTVIARITGASPNPVKTAAALQAAPVVAVAEPDFATPGRLAARILRPGAPDGGGPDGGGPDGGAPDGSAQGGSAANGSGPGGSAPGGTGGGRARGGRTPVLDTLAGRQWHLRNTGRLEGSSFNLKPGADARVVAAWEAMGGFGARDCIVAVIDDGFDLTHDDLRGSGKVVAPWDFTRRSADPRPEFNDDYPRLDHQSGAWVGDWHGTACAGVAVGEQNGRGILGAAPLARLMPVRWGASLTDAEVEAWFDYVAAQGAWVVSCSWGADARNYPLSTRKAAAIARCARTGRGGRGAVICFAAGNEDRDIDDLRDPLGASVNGFATHPDVIAVAASTSRDQKAHYSNRGAAIAVCAPSNGQGGRGIFTCDVTGAFTRSGVTVAAGYDAGDYHGGFGGTSSATPLVAGICALVLSVNPQLTAAEVKQVITATARKIGDPAAYGAGGHSPLYGYGCIDAAAAVRAARAPRRAAAATRAATRRRGAGGGRAGQRAGEPAGMRDGQPAGERAGQPAGELGAGGGPGHGANGVPATPVPA